MSLAYPTIESARNVAKSKAFRKKYGRGYIATKVNGGYGLKQRLTVRGARKAGKVHASDGHDMLTVIASHGGIAADAGDERERCILLTQARTAGDDGAQVGRPHRAGAHHADASGATVLDAPSACRHVIDGEATARGDSL